MLLTLSLESQHSLLYGRELLPPYTQNGYLWAKHTTDGSEACQLFYYDGGTSWRVRLDTTGGDSVFNFGSTPVVGTEVELTIVYDGSDLLAYENGAFSASDGTVGGPATTFQRDFIMGAKDNEGVFEEAQIGLHNYWLVYDRDLTPNEIKFLNANPLALFELADVPLLAIIILHLIIIAVAAAGGVTLRTLSLTFDGTNDWVKLRIWSDSVGIGSFHARVMFTETIGANEQIITADCSSSSERTFQFRRSDAGKLQFVTFTSGVPFYSYR